MFWPLDIILVIYPMVSNSDIRQLMATNNHSRYIHFIGQLYRNSSQYYGSFTTKSNRNIDGHCNTKLYFERIYLATEPNANLGSRNCKHDSSNAFPKSFSNFNYRKRHFLSNLWSHSEFNYHRRSLRRSLLHRLIF